MSVNPAVSGVFKYCFAAVAAIFLPRNPHKRSWKRFDNQVTSCIWRFVLKLWAVWRQIQNMSVQSSVHIITSVITWCFVTSAFSSGRKPKRVSRGIPRYFYLVRPRVLLFNECNHGRFIRTRFWIGNFWQSLSLILMLANLRQEKMSHGLLFDDKTRDPVRGFRDKG